MAGAAVFDMQQGEKMTTNAGTTLLDFSGVSMTFPDGTRALDNVSLSVRAGEFVTVVGPSGCGKSTLLRIASNLESNTGGVCTVDRDSIGYVFQDATLMPWRTVVKNVELIAELHKVGKEERAILAAEAIDLVGLRGIRRQIPTTIVGRHEDACIARPVSGHETESVSLRRTVRCSR